VAHCAHECGWAAPVCVCGAPQLRDKTRRHTHTHTSRSQPTRHAIYIQNYGRRSRTRAPWLARRTPVQNGYLLRRGGGQNRWHSLVNCNHGDSSSSRFGLTLVASLCAQPCRAACACSRALRGCAAGASMVVTLAPASPKGRFTPVLFRKPPQLASNAGQSGGSRCRAGSWVQVRMEMTALFSTRPNSIPLVGVFHALALAHPP
jgi:hypothetical protein